MFLKVSYIKSCIGLICALKAYFDIVTSKILSGKVTLKAYISWKKLHIRVFHVREIKI